MTLSAWLAEARIRYHRRAAALGRVTAAMSDRDVAGFVICTPRQPYERALHQWRVWRDTGRVVGALPNLRAALLAALPPEHSLRRKFCEPTRA